MFPGKKSYVVSIVGTIVSAGNLILKFYAGEAVTITDIMALLGAIGIGTVRAGIKNK